MKHAVPISKAFLDATTGTENFLLMLRTLVALGFDDALGAILKKNDTNMQ